MYYNARWYDPSLGRFAQADTIVPGGAQGYDRYAYVNNDPVRYTDPSGHKPCWATSHYSCRLSQEIVDREFVKYNAKDKPSATAFFVSQGFAVTNKNQSQPQQASHYGFENVNDNCKGLRCAVSQYDSNNATLSANVSATPPNPPLYALVSLAAVFSVVTAFVEIGIVAAEVAIAPIDTAMPIVGIPLSLILTVAGATVLDLDIALVVYAARVAEHPEVHQEFEISPLKLWGLSN